MTMGATPLTVELEKDGALLRLRLSRPKANIVDAAMIAALRAWAAAKTPLMSFSGWRSTKGASAIFPSSTRSSAGG